MVKHKGSRAALKHLRQKRAEAQQHHDAAIAEVVREFETRIARPSAESPEGHIAASETYIGQRRDRHDYHSKPQ